MQLETIRVLLIEDDPGDARLIKEMLLEGGQGRFAFKLAGTLKEGIREVNLTQPDVIILDLSLPDSTGLDTLFALHTEVPGVPIIVLTGLDEITLVGVQAVQGGAQDYLVKSDVDSKLLRRSIRYAIERHDIESQLRRNEEEYRSLIDDVFDTTTVAVFILDADFTVAWANEAVETYFDLDREDILGRDKYELIKERIKHIFADPEHFESYTLEAYQVNDFTYHFECHVLPEGDRAERWLEHWSQPIRNGMYQGGRIEQYMDITDHKRLESAERQQRQFAEALNDIATTLTSTLDLGEVLERILSNLSRIVPHNTASITLIEDDHFWVARRRDSNKRDTQEIVAEHQVEYRPYLETMANTGSPLLVPELQPDDRSTTNHRAYMGAPILLQNQTIGFINLLNTIPNSFTQEGLERLKAFADLSAIAIQNARLYEQAGRLATLEERQRLARDLHDSVSQTMFTCRTMLESAVKRFDTDPVRSRQLVEEVHQLSISVLSEMRILLLELRPEALTQVSLKQLFEQYLLPVQVRRQFDLEIGIDDISPLPSAVQIALYRITQEALNNITKHARATKVSVHVSQQGEIVEMTLCDNGVGFDAGNASSTSLGLNIMQERAAEIGAQMRIESSPGKGTCVRVRWRREETR